MTFSASNLHLTQEEDLGTWGIGLENQNLAYVSGLLPGDVIFSPEDIITPETTATLMVHSVFGSVLSETDIVRSEEGIFGRYARTLVSRVEKSRDTGMAHPDVIPMWQHLSKKQRGEVASIVVSSCDSLDGFPPVDNLNVAYASHDAEIDMGETYVPVMVPAVVSIRSGLAVVVPSIRGVTYYESAFNHLAYPHNTGISQVHIWDVQAKRVTKVDGSDFEEHLIQQRAKLLES